MEDQITRLANLAKALRSVLLLRRQNYGSLEFSLARPLSESRRIRISRIQISRSLDSQVLESICSPL